ncbi:MAG: pirin family protein [Candidatus Binataceae bacterium]
MVKIRKSAERGQGTFDWLDSRHTFSFADYFDPKHMGFRALRVINEDRIAPGSGFPSHPHREMEIITYVLEGAVEHKDSLGTGSVITVGEIQRMSAGTGIVHSEFNHSPREPLHLLQIWILPNEKGIAPGYEQRRFDREAARGRFLELAGPAGTGCVTIHSDARLMMTTLDAGKGAELALEHDHAWIQVARGAVMLGGNSLESGDGAAITNERTIRLQAAKPAEILLFDLA